MKKFVGKNIRKIQMDDDLVRVARDLGMCLGD